MKTHFENKYADGDAVGIYKEGVAAAERIDIRETQELIVFARKSPTGWLIMSKEYVVDDLAEAQPEITLLNGFTNAEVLQLATEAELMAKGLRGGWVPPASGLAATHSLLNEMPTNLYFGQSGGTDIASLSALATLAAVPILVQNQTQRQRAQSAGNKILGLGDWFMGVVGL